ncbi:MAG: hypothetical protein ACM3Q4_15240 [Acidobacteriota bacterium]
MRTPILIALMLGTCAALAGGCRNDLPDASLSNEPYDRMLFTRDGGGNIHFYFKPVENYSGFSYTVTQVNFRDTNYTSVVGIKDGGRLAELVRSVLAGKVALTGDYKPSTLPTGTWARFYVVRADQSTIQITNRELLDRLWILEGLAK